MKNILSKLLAISGLGLIISGLFPLWISVPIGLGLLIASPFLGIWLEKSIDPRISASEEYLKKKRAKKVRREFIAKNREKIGFEYLHATFLLAGYVASLDGKVCSAEQKVLDERFYHLRLDKQQMQAAIDYFQQGQSSDFDIGKTLDTFMYWCGDTPELCESLLTTQFAFVEADGKVDVAELRAVSHIAIRLGLQKKFQNLLEEYRLKIEEEAEKIAKAKIEEQKRQREQKRYQAEQERLNKKRNTKERKLHLALALLGLPANASITDIKRAYRKQIKRHHPDRLLAQGYPQELLAEATKQSADINRAYRLLKEHYRFR